MKTTTFSGRAHCWSLVKTRLLFFFMSKRVKNNFPWKYIFSCVSPSYHREHPVRAKWPHREQKCWDLLIVPWICWCFIASLGLQFHNKWSVPLVLLDDYMGINRHLHGPILVPPGSHWYNILSLGKMTLLVLGVLFSSSVRETQISPHIFIRR